MRHFVIVDIDYDGVLIEADGFSETAEQWLDRFKGNDGTPAPAVPILFRSSPPTDDIGAEGQQAFDTTANTWWQREGGVWKRKAILRIRDGQIASVPPEDDPDPGTEAPPPLESADGTFVPDDAPFIFTSAQRDFRLGDVIGAGPDRRVTLNTVAFPSTIKAVGILYYAPPPATARSVFIVDSAGAWSLYSGGATGPNGSGWTPIAGDPRPVNQAERDPTIAVSILPDGKKVYRFSAAHADPDSPFSLPWTLASFDNDNPGGHDYLLLGEVLDELGKDEGDVVITYPGGGVDARLSIAGTPFQIDFTDVSATSGFRAPNPYFTDVLSSTTDNAPSLAKTIDPGTGKSNRGLLVRVVVKGSGSVTTSDISSVTWGGIALTRVTAANQFNGNFGRAALFRLVGPAEGPNSLVVTFDNSGKASVSVSACVAFLEDVDQSTPLGPNLGIQNDITGTPSVSFATTQDNSIVMGFGGWMDAATNPVTPGSGVTEYVDIDVGNFDDPGGSGAWMGSKPALSAGSATINCTLTNGISGVLFAACEVRGVAIADLFDVGPHDSTNLAGGGPDIATDLAPADWPVPDGTGIGPAAPTPDAFWAGVLTTHGFVGERNRVYSASEFAAFRATASAVRLMGPIRTPPFGNFADDSEAIGLIEDALSAGLKVLYCPFSSDTGGISFPVASDTAAINTYGARLASIAAVAATRGWGATAFGIECFSKPFSSLGQADAKQVYQAWVNLIRAQNANIWIACMGNGREGNTYEQGYQSWAKTTPLTDPRSGADRIAYTSSEFDSQYFTRQGSGPYPTGLSYAASGYGLVEMRASMQAFRAWANEHQVQIAIMETGVIRFAPSLADRQAYIADRFTACRESAIPCFLYADDNSDGNIGQAWYSIMQGTAGAARFVPSWAALIGSPGS